MYYHRFIHVFLRSMLVWWYFFNYFLVCGNSFGIRYFGMWSSSAIITLFVLSIRKALPSIRLRIPAYWFLLSPVNDRYGYSRRERIMTPQACCYSLFCFAFFGRPLIASSIFASTTHLSLLLLCVEKLRPYLFFLLSNSHLRSLSQFIGVSIN